MGEEIKEDKKKIIIKKSECFLECGVKVDGNGFEIKDGGSCKHVEKNGFLILMTAMTPLSPGGLSAAL